MNDMATIQKRYFNSMQRAIRVTLERSTRETDAVAMSAIRRYHASLDGDYKTMWEENEWLLLRANERLEDTEDSLRRQTRRLDAFMREVELLKRFHNIE